MLQMVLIQVVRNHKGLLQYVSGETVKENLEIGELDLIGGEPIKPTKSVVEVDSQIAKVEPFNNIEYSFSNKSFSYPARIGYFRLYSKKGVPSKNL